MWYDDFFRKDRQSDWWPRSVPGFAELLRYSANVAIRAPTTIRFGDRAYATQTRPRNFVFHRDRLHLIDSVAVYLLSQARMQRTGRARCFYARLRSYSDWRNSHGVLIAQRHTAHQKKAAMVLGFLACCNCFRDCSPRYIGLYRAPDLFHCISSGSRTGLSPTFRTPPPFASKGCTLR